MSDERLIGKHGAVGVHAQLPRDGRAVSANREVDGDVKANMNMMFAFTSVPRLVHNGRERIMSWTLRVELDCSSYRFLILT
jgi:hypothetical protein